jgi:hypothetical protein
MTNENQFHEDAVINAGLAKLEAKAAFYKLAQGVISGKFDTDFTTWKNDQTINAEEVKSVPETANLVEWCHIDANLSELLTFKRSVETLMTEVNLAIFGHYAKKNVRGQVPADTDLGAVRADLVKVLNGTVTMIEAGIIDGMTVEMILNLPSLKSMAKDMGAPSPRRTDGTWVLPNAGSNGDSTNAPVGNLRAHNTQVKFVVDGILYECSTLGEACAKLFGAKKPAEVAKLFDDWNGDYFAVGAEEPKKAVVRDGRKIWLTKVG